MKPGQRVRIKTDPARVGVLTERKQAIGRRVKLGVEFLDGAHEFVLEGLLEIVPDEEDRKDLVQSGRYSGRQVLRNSVTYHRLSGRLANVIYSMESTDTDFYPYQFKPVLNLLDSPSKGLLIADEVGLGKTIEAGLIWTELRSRHDANRLLVVCPAMLREKWVRELRKRFGVQARIADATELLETLEQSEKAELDGFALVCSKDGLRPPRGFEEENDLESPRARLAQFLLDHEADSPVFDLVVVDEAHYMRNQESMTSRLGRLLRPVTDYMVLLSATPIQLASEDLFQLLRILDSQTYAHIDSFRHILSANGPINQLYDAIQSEDVAPDEFTRMLDEAVRHPLLNSNRQLAHLRARPQLVSDLKDKRARSEIAADLEKVNLLSKIVSRTRKRHVTEWRVVREAIPEYIQMNSLEEAFYENVTAAVAEYCRGKDASMGFLLTTPQRQIASCMPAAVKAWQDKMIKGDDLSAEVYGDFGLEEVEKAPVELGPLTTHLVSRVRSLGSYEALRRSDSKYQRLEEMLSQFFLDYPEEKIIIFTYFRQTIVYLQDRLAEAGIKAKALMGGMSESKDEAVQRFESDPSIRVLISSEVASEGVDLQFCRLLINYDLPWNPMKVEQRIGRIDRIGQKAEKIIVWNLFYADTVDARIYQRLHERLQIFNHALGGLESVLGDEVARLGYELLSGRLTPEEQERRIRQTEQAMENLRRDNIELEDKASYLVAHSEHILNEVVAAKALQRFIDGKDLAMYFTDYFSRYYPGTEIRRTSVDALEYAITLSGDARVDLSAFLRQRRIKKPTFLLDSLGKKVTFIFDNKVKSTSALKEVIDQFHPVIQFVNSMLKGGKEQLIPTATQIARVDAGNVQKGAYGFFVQRWQVSGVRESERLAYAAVHLESGDVLSDEDAERLVNSASSAGDDWPAARNVTNLEAVERCYEACEDRLEEAYGRYIDRLKRENDDRADVLTKTAENHFQGQISQIEDVIANYRRSGKTKMIPANEGKIKKYRQKLADRTQEIKNGRNLAHSPSDVALGVILVK